MEHLILGLFHVTYVWRRLCADVCARKKRSDIKRGNQTSNRKKHRKLTVTIPNRSKEVLLWKQVCADTFSEEQRSRIPSRVIPQTAGFLVILPSKRKHWRVSNRIKLWSHRCLFWKGHNWSRCQQKALYTKARFSVSLLTLELFANLALNTPFTGLSTLRCAHL